MEWSFKFDKVIAILLFVILMVELVVSYAYVAQATHEPDAIRQYVVLDVRSLEGKQFKGIDKKLSQLQQDKVFYDARLRDFDSEGKINMMFRSDQMFLHGENATTSGQLDVNFFEFLFVTGTSGVTLRYVRGDEGWVNMKTKAVRATGNVKSRTFEIDPERRIDYFRLFDSVGGQTLLEVLDAKTEKVLHDKRSSGDGRYSTGGVDLVPPIRGAGTFRREER